MFNSNRRSFVKSGIATAGALAIVGTSLKALAETCSQTPPQTSGPFYPGEELFHPDNDLTVLPGRLMRASGQVIYVMGKVIDSSCRPIEGATLEIWQACSTGRYNNPKDDNPAKLDPNFKYWGETFSDSVGNYTFKTVKPGAYPADVDWMRPPHIHFKVTRRGYKDLITQLYFKGNPLNEKDLILLDIPVQDRPNVVVDFQPAPMGLDAGALVGNFNITLQSVR